MHQSATATVQSRALNGFRSVGVLDIVSAMPVRSLVAKASHDAPLTRLVKWTGAICGLGACGRIFHSAFAQVFQFLKMLVCFDELVMCFFQVEDDFVHISIC